MKPSPEAIEAAWVAHVDSGFVAGLTAAYAVDMPNVERPLADAVRELADTWERMARDHGSPAARVNIGKKADALRALLAQHTQEP